MIQPPVRTDNRHLGSSHALEMVEGPGKQFLSAMLGPGQNVARLVKAVENRRRKERQNPIVQDFYTKLDTFRRYIQRDKNRLDGHLDIILSRDDDVSDEILKLHHPQGTRNIRFIIECYNASYALTVLEREAKAGRVFEGLAFEAKDELESCIADYKDYLCAWNDMVAGIRRERRAAKRAPVFQ